MLYGSATLPANLPSLTELIQEHEAKTNGGQVTRVNDDDGTVEVIAEYLGVDAEISQFEQSVSTMKTRMRVGTHYVGPVFTHEPLIDASTVKRDLLASAWWKIYEGLQIDTLAPAGDKSRIEQMITGHCPDLTLENIREHFGGYLLDPRGSILRGLAEQFAKLDRAFRSHEKMKIGVKGLPKRVIIEECYEDHAYSNNGASRLMGVINAIRTYAKQPLIDRAAMSDFMKSAQQQDAHLDGLKLRRFMNGNAHLFFDTDTLKMVNLALAEYYGDVLPDCPEAQSGKKSNSGTAVSKDLQFYRTPAAAADILVSHAHPSQPYDKRDIPLKVLEPSCGDGAILDALGRFCANPDHHVQVEAMGVEVDPTRAEISRRKGYNVICSNFLNMEPNRIYDLVLMNPPFYRKHYQKHVEHAQKFLKPSGKVYAILPITAVTDHGCVDPGSWGYDKWRDLPVGSFSESNTNINTGIARFFAEGS